MHKYFFLLPILLLSHLNASDEFDALSNEFSKNKISHKVDLCRSVNDKIIAQYTDKIQLVENITYPLCTSKNANYANYLASISQNDSYKNHMLVRGVYAYKNEAGSLNTFSSFFKSDLFMLSEDKAKIIDWGSNISKNIIQDYHHRPSVAGNGHSEAQFIEDINNIWLTNSDALISHFIHTGKKSVASLMCGISFHSALDACDTCLESIRNFRKKNQKGQQSISYAIRDKLKCSSIPFEGEKEDGFIVQYHSYYPYKEADYSAEDENYIYKLAYQYGFSYGRRDNFYITDEKVDNSYTLAQKKITSAEKDLIYSHIHLLSDKQSTYSNQLKGFRF